MPICSSLSICSDSEPFSVTVNPAEGRYYVINHIGFCCDRCNRPVTEYVSLIVG